MGVGIHRNNSLFIEENGKTALDIINPDNKSVMLSVAYQGQV